MDRNFGRGCSEQQRSAVMGLHRRNGGWSSERGEAAEDRAIGNVSSVETVVAGARRRGDAEL
jgi:hypothetical protein